MEGTKRRLLEKYVILILCELQTFFTEGYVLLYLLITFFVSITDSDTFKVSGELHLIGSATPSSVK